MEAGSVPVRSVLEEVDKRILAPTAGTAKVDKFPDWRHCCCHGSNSSSWIMDYWKSNKDLPGQ